VQFSQKKKTGKTKAKDKSDKSASEELPYPL
jgi:hypothetical protein